MTLLKSLSAAVTAVFLITAAPAAHATIVPESGVLNFKVVRDGEEIGTHVLSFRQTGDKLDVTIRTRIAVKVAFITVYRFEHDGHEVWENGRLIRMETKTHDDGTDHTLNVASDGTGKLNIVGDGKRMSAAADAVPASLWNPAFIRTNALMNSLVGTPLDIKIIYRGEETVTAKGVPVKTRHYSMTGEFERELWYDQNWVLVHMELKGKDGSNVTYVLK